jgi:hypothetical protein
MTRFLFFILLFSSTLFVGCENNDENEDKVETKDISHNGSIETQLTTQHLPNNLDVLVTTHKVWKNGVVEREVVHTDTIPALGVGTLTAADTTGNTTTATGQKDYEFYITVK